MNTINLHATEDTPRVVFDKINGIFEISGRSLPEDVSKFYNPLLLWLTEYMQDPNAFTHLILNFEYFNTASSKLILDLLTKAEKIKNVKIVWCHFDDDEDMLEAGQEFSELVDVPFDFKKIIAS